MLYILAITSVLPLYMAQIALSVATYYWLFKRKLAKKWLLLAAMGLFLSSISVYSIRFWLTATVADEYESTKLSVYLILASGVVYTVYLLSDKIEGSLSKDSIQTKE